MKKSVYIVIIALGFINLSLAQQNESDSLKYIPSSFVEKLLKEHDSLNIVFHSTKDKLTKNQIERIFSQAENTEYSVKKTQLALKLTVALGDNWNFDESLKSENTLNFNTFEEFEEFNNSKLVFQHGSFEEDGTLKKHETRYKNGSKQIIEKDKNGQYVKITIDENGIESVTEIKDISEFLMSTKTKKIIKD